MFRKSMIPLLALAATLAACKSSTEPMKAMPKDPATAPRASIDRFSDAAGTLFKRSANSSLPGADEPIDFDQGPFITEGLGPSGGQIAYYNFDVMSTTPAPIYVLFRQGESMPVDGQLNIVDVIPGDPGYNDFWNVVKVTVPSDYVANTVTSLQEIQDAGYSVEATDMLVNCPIVPDGSTASMRVNSTDTGLTMGWYEGQIVFYFNFLEAPLQTTSAGLVPLADIYVSFNINPGQAGGGPPSGFKTDANGRAHNVADSLPGDAGYSPLWDVNIYDNADFDSVMDLQSALAANILAEGAATVNCPIVALP